MEGRAPTKEELAARMSAAALDNIHSAAIVSCRRRLEYKKDDGSYEKVSVLEKCLITVYRFIGFIILILQVIFLWSLLDSFSYDYLVNFQKQTPLSPKLTLSMTGREFGSIPLNMTILAWNDKRSSSNVKLCKQWVLNCGQSWLQGIPCLDENSIKLYCPPWDYETYLLGINGTTPILYPTIDGGKMSIGGQPYWGSITKSVLIQWSFGMDVQQDLYSKLSHRYAVSLGYAYGAEMLCVIGFNFLFFFAVFFADIAQLVDQIGLCYILDLPSQEGKVEDRRRDFWSPLRMVMGDIYISLRVVGTASMTVVAAALLVNAKGVQAVLSGAIALTFLVNIDDMIFKSLNDQMMLNKTKFFTDFLQKQYKIAREVDARSVDDFAWLKIDFLSPENLFYGRYRSILSGVLTFSLWIVSVTIALRCEIGFKSPNDYFNVYDGFAAIGGICFMIFAFGVCVMSSCPGDLRILDIIKFGASLCWVFVFSYKIIFWGFLFWSSDVSSYRECDMSQGMCETTAAVIARVLGSQFVFHSRSALQDLHPNTPVLPLEIVQANMTVLMFLSFAIHVCLTLRHQICASSVVPIDHETASPVPVPGDVEMATLAVKNNSDYVQTVATGRGGGGELGIEPLQPPQTSLPATPEECDGSELQLKVESETSQQDEVAISPTVVPE